MGVVCCIVGEVSVNTLHPANTLCDNELWSISEV